MEGGFVEEVNDFAFVFILLQLLHERDLFLQNLLSILILVDELLVCSPVSNSERMIYASECSSPNVDAVITCKL